MNTKRVILTGCSVLMLSGSAALAGPCNTGSAARDAGSGPARMGDSQTTGMTGNSAQHPPTGTMNRSAGDVAASSQDAQQQMQGQPTAAQKAEGAKGDRKTAGNDC